jgi:hypothetical protein
MTALYVATSVGASVTALFLGLFTIRHLA